MKHDNSLVWFKLADYLSDFYFVTKFFFQGCTTVLSLPFNGISERIKIGRLFFFFKKAAYVFCLEFFLRW